MNFNNKKKEDEKYIGCLQINIAYILYFTFKFYRQAFFNLPSEK